MIFLVTIATVTKGNIYSARSAELIGATNPWGFWHVWTDIFGEKMSQPPNSVFPVIAPRT